MLRYFLRRLLVAIPTLFAIIAISFFMIRIAPGGPFDANRKATPEVMANLNKAYHLDEPLYEQFGRYLWGVMHLDFGPSFKYRDYTVSELILRGFPISAQIGLWALLIAAIIGISIGTVAALRQNSPIDYAVMTFGMVGIAVPTFITAPLFQLVFALWLHWLPVASWDGGWQHMVLPVLALSLPPIAAISRLTRGSMIESLRSNHVRTARAKGLGVRLTVWRHALLGGLLPTIAYLGPATAGIVTGSVVIERAFSIPGIGRYFVEAASNRDYTLVMGTVIFYGGLIIIANLLVDLTYSLLDPKVRYE
ncbi:MAG TPA: oligopeptide ABC transporter permease OppB [Aliidongia sp.]|nr:oligopeptide ABC transporter permease OppB [Aliidongia sp.]